MISSIVAAVLTAALSAPAGAGALTAVVPGTPDGDGMVRAIVVLREQVDPGVFAAQGRRQRQAALVRALRALAARDQVGVLDLLRQRRAQGLADGATSLWVLNAVAVRAVPSVIRELAARPEVGRIEPDATVRAPAPTVTADATAVQPNVAAVNAPALWDLGVRGQGTVVANMDTGVDASHPDLAGRWRGGAHSWYDPNGEHPTVPTDVNGHGTATMGVMVGGSAGGTSIGVAPDATWIAVKIFNDRGSASASAIHLGYQWLLDPDGDPATPDAPDVVDNSWSGSSAGCILDFQPDLRNLRAAGILPVFAAGNYGPTASTVLSPANLPEALSVGSVDNTGTIDGGSSRGPSACGQAVAPRVVAPGVGVHTTDLYGGYVDASGTSLAAPHAAGVLALLLSAYPGLDADRQQAALETTAVDLGSAGADNTYGYGRVDALAAYQWLAVAPDYTVAVAPAQAGTVQGGGVSYTVTVSPVNGFAGDVALGLGGLSAAQASWAFNPDVIHGGGSAQLAVTTAASLAPGTYPLTVTATGGGLTRTAPASLVVTGTADFTLAASPASAAVAAGSATAFTVSVGAVNGFTGTVGLSLAGLPAGVGTATFSPAQVSGAGTAQLTVSTLAGAAPGTYPLTVTGTSGSTGHSVGLTLQVNPPPDFALTASPPSVTVYRRQTATYTVSASVTGGFAGPVTLSVSGLPAGSSAAFGPNPLAAPGTSVLSITTTGYTTRGTFTLWVTGKSGGLTRKTSVLLTVR